MQPFTVVLGILLGSVFAIAFSLGTVLLIFFLRQGGEPRLANELPELVWSTAIFFVLSAVAAMAFVGSLRSAPWRRWPAVLLIGGIVALGWHYWPQ